MLNKKFEAYKVSREIKKVGSSYLFYRKTKNEYGEPTKANEPIGELKGIYHEYKAGTYIAVKTQDATQIRSKKAKMILCLWEHVEALKLLVGDNVTINNMECYVTGVNNIQGWNIVAEICLEVVDNGNSES